MTYTKLGPWVNDLANPAVSAGALDHIESGIYTASRAEDPRAYGLTGGADDSTALQATFDAAGTNGVVELPSGSINYLSTLTLPAGMELRGVGEKASTLQGTTDIVALRSIGGEGTAVKNLKIANSFTGTRTTHDIEIVNAFHTVLDHVEIALSQLSLIKGGIHFSRDAAEANEDKCFMPVLTDVWVRNGVLKIVDTTDVKVHGGWVWGTYTGAAGAVELSAASNCSFVDFDIVPSVNAGYLVSGGLSNLTIIGGMLDGSYDATSTGWGFRTTDYVRGLVISGTKFWHMYKGGASLYNVRRATITGCTFSENNRGNSASYPDINVESCQAIVVFGNNFGAPTVRTTKAMVYVEDVASQDNAVAFNVLEYDSGIAPNGHYYDPAMFSVQPSAYVQNNLPDLSWPQTRLLVKPANYQVLKGDLFNQRTILATGTTTITLPSAASVHAGDVLRVKNSGVATVTLATSLSQTIDGSATYSLVANQAATVVSDGANWYVIASFP